MKEIDLFSLDKKSFSPIVSAADHINCHYIADPTMEKKRILTGFPGSSVFSDTGGEERGLWATSNAKGMYSVVGKNVFRISNSGEFKKIGEIDSDRFPVMMADSGIQLMIVDGTSGYIVELDPPEGKEQKVTKITDEYFPPNPTSVIYNTGRFLVNSRGTGRFYGSDIFDGESWDGLNFATAETAPDNIIALVNGNFGVFYIMGNQTIEIWINDGGPNFPYSLMSGGVIKTGLLNAPSIATIGNMVIFLGVSEGDGTAFYMLNGNSIQKISNAQIGYELREMRNVASNFACAYSSNSSPIYQITFLFNGTTYFYDISSGLWGLRRTRGRIGHLFKFSVFYLNNFYFSSHMDFKIYKLEPTFIKDGDWFQDLEWVGRHLMADGNRLPIRTLQIQMEVGQGTQQDIRENPPVMLSYSKDGGFTFTPELKGVLGELGHYLQRLIWRRLGYARDIVFKLRITELIKRKIITCYMEIG